MEGISDWLKSEENGYFAIHLALVVLLAVISQAFTRGYTTFAFPAIILLAAVSLMWNYPVKAIKEHGLFSEFLIELRLLWLVVLGLLFELVVYDLFQGKINNGLAVIALVGGLALGFFSRSRLQERIVRERGFK
ncbi:hypothetical protein HY095_01435 [Candidatus Micrarchaeota archaeon]|nr:hypothetical protein [Candidatus Micrarchaeota archaeon]